MDLLILPGELILDSTNISSFVFLVLCWRTWLLNIKLSLVSMHKKVLHGHVVLKTCSIQFLEFGGSQMALCIQWWWCWYKAVPSCYHPTWSTVGALTPFLCGILFAWPFCFDLEAPISLYYFEYCETHNFSLVMSLMLYLSWGWHLTQDKE